MAESRHLDLRYGLLGDPTYDSCEHTWQFTRENLAVPRLKPVDGLQPVSDCSKISLEQGDGTASDFQAVKGLLDDCPLLAAAYPATFLNVRKSVSARASHQRHDPSVGNLCARATAISRQWRKHPVNLPILATISGSRRELLKLTLLNRQLLKWDNGKGFELSQLTAKGGEEGWWRAPQGAPILQICVPRASTGEIQGHLAVRTAEEITILQPVLHSEPRPIQRDGFHRFDFVSSRLSAHECLSLRHKQASRAPFSDVSFNPCDSLQLGTIDNLGSWDIWNIKLAINERDVWTIERGFGDVMRPTKEQTFSNGHSNDFCAKIFWVCNYRTVIVARSLQIMLAVLVREKKVLDLTDLVLGRRGDWLIDAQSRRQSSEHILFLTSTRLTILYVETKADKHTLQKVHLAVSAQLSWLHYRNPQDDSLFLAHVETQFSDERNST